ncbi:MAG: FMN-binding protein [Hominimerdicola sp.]
MILTVIVSIASFNGLPDWVNNYIIGLFSRGAFATALWCVVMWTGAFPNGSKPIKALMPVRGELSIFAAILTLGHNIKYGKTYFVRMVTDADRMSTEQLIAGNLTIIMLAIMIPLTIMSFPQIRKKMSAKLWKKIQRTAYIFYALIYIHVMVLLAPLAKAGREGYFLSILIYSAVFIGYAVCRIRKQYVIKKKPENTKTLNIICIIAFLIILAIPCIYARKDSSTQQVSTNRESSQTYTVSLTTTTGVTTTSMTETTTLTGTTSAVTESTTETTSSSDNSNSLSEKTDTEIVTEPIEQSVEEQYVVTEEIPVETQPEPVYIYNNGTYTATAYGYDGDVEVTITIENDIITSITGASYESDTWYYDSAAGSVIPQILQTQSCQVDAYSGATYSSEAIMNAVQNALNMARK